MLSRVCVRMCVCAHTCVLLLLNWLHTKYQNTYSQHAKWGLFWDFWLVLTKLKACILVRQVKLLLGKFRESGCSIEIVFDIFHKEQAKCEAQRIPLNNCESLWDLFYCENWKVVINDFSGSKLDCLNETQCKCKNTRVAASSPLSSLNTIYLLPHTLALLSSTLGNCFWPFLSSLWLDAPTTKCKMLFRTSIRENKTHRATKPVCLVRQCCI